MSTEEAPIKKVAAKKVAPAKREQVATYVGGLEGIIVHLPSGRILTFSRDETHPILANEATALAAHPEFKLAYANKENN